MELYIVYTCTSFGLSGVNVCSGSSDLISKTDWRIFVWFIYNYPYVCYSLSQVAYQYKYTYSVQTPVTVATFTHVYGASSGYWVVY